MKENTKIYLDWPCAYISICEHSRSWSEGRGPGQVTDLTQSYRINGSYRAQHWGNTGVPWLPWHSCTSDRKADFLQKGQFTRSPKDFQDMAEQPFVLSTPHAQDPVWEACMISLTMTGQSLSMWKDILQFFKAMYDLTEGLYLSSLIFIETNMLQFITP